MFIINNNMSPKRKRIYIIIIIVCVLLSAGVLIWGGIQSSGPTSITTPTLVSSDQSASPPLGNVDNQGVSVYSAPAIFPQNTRLDSTTLNLSKFQSLQTYTKASVDPSELNRDDPFAAYK
jgi:hypothetical protein